AAQVLIEGFKSELATEAEQLLYPRALRLANRITNAIDEKSALLLKVHAQTCATWEKEIAARHIYKVPMDNYSKGKIRFVEFINGTKT
ncbi:jg20745, partial [Pararge aegeria aegeria]